MKNRYSMKIESNKGQREKKNRTVHIYTSDFNIEESLAHMKFISKALGFYFPAGFGLQSAVVWAKGNIINRIFDGVVMCIVMALLIWPIALVAYGIVWIGVKFQRLVIQVVLDDIEESYLMKGRKEIPLKELKFKAYRRSPLRKVDTIKGFRNGSKLSCVRICEGHMPDEFYTLVSDLTTMNLIINPTELKEFSPHYYKV